MKTYALVVVSPRAEGGLSREWLEKEGDFPTWQAAQNRRLTLLDKQSPGGISTLHIRPAEFAHRLPVGVW